MRILVTILTVVSFIGCQTKRADDQHKLTDTIKSGNVIIPSEERMDSVEASTDEFDYSECTRGQAESIVRKSIYPNATFELNDNNHSGTETVDLENGDRLIISNHGCEYYVLTFRFETSRFEADTTDILFWLDKGYKLMAEVEKGIDSYHLVQGIQGLKEFLETSKPLALGEEIVFDDGEIRDYATLDRIQKIDDNKYGIEISLMTGPL